MDFLADLLGAMVSMWIFTRIIYKLTFKNLNRKQQSGLGFVLGIIFIIFLTAVGWFSIDSSIPFFVALLLWFVLDVTEVTTLSKIKDISEVTGPSKTKNESSANPES